MSAKVLHLGDNMTELDTYLQENWRVEEDFLVTDDGGFDDSINHTRRIAN